MWAVFKRKKREFAFVKFVMKGKLSEMTGNLINFKLVKVVLIKILN